MRSLSRIAFVTLAALFLAQTASAIEPDKLLPGNAEVVVGINLKQLKDSKLFEKYAKAKLEELLKNEHLQEMIKATGLDPMKDIDGILLAGKADAQMSKKAVIILKGNFNEEKLVTAAKKVAADGKFKFDTKKEGTLTVHTVTPETGEAGYLTFPSKSTLVISPSKEYAVEVASGKAGKVGDKMSTALGKIGGKESAFMSVVMTEDLKALAAKQNPAIRPLVDKLEYMAAGLTVTEGVKMNLVIGTADADTAAGLKLAVSLALPAAKKQAKDNGAPAFVIDLIDKVKVATDGNALTVSLDIPGDTVDKIIKEAMHK